LKERREILSSGADVRNSPMAFVLLHFEYNTQPRNLAVFTAFYFWGEQIDTNTQKNRTGGEIQAHRGIFTRKETNK
jgi:hypothetical protein